MTTLDVSLSQTLQSELDTPGVWAYAVYFDNASTIGTWTTLVDNGTVENSGTEAIALPSPMIGGKVYFLIQSETPTAGADPDPLPNDLIRSQSDINFSNASAYDFRYDSFEVTLQNSADDEGNLTSVNGFGLPMEVSVPYDNGATATVGYAISGSSLVTEIQHINTSETYTYDYTSGPLNGDFRIAVSPAAAVSGTVSNPPFGTSDWSNYVTNLEGPQAQDIVLSGEFNGTADAAGVWHNGGYYAYQLQWDSAGGYFLLVPLPSSQIQGIIQITPANLENSIYSTLGSVNVYAKMADVTGGTPFLSNMNTGANNQWGAVLTQFLIGFTAGYYGESGASPNSQVGTPIDLAQNVNWDPIYAFGQNLAGPLPSYVTSDPYAYLFYARTNSYGAGYSDALMSQYAAGGPLISVSQPGMSADVSDINLTIYADGETPAGYTAPKIYDYIAPGTLGYEPVSGPGAGTHTNIVLDFASGVADNAGVVLARTDTITLGILTGDGGGAPVWSTVTFAGDSPSAGADGLWQNWTITYAAGTYTAAPTAIAVAQPAGSILIDGFPTAANGVSWYRIVASGGTISSKTFDLYTTTMNGQFDNPNFPNQQGALAVDGLATVTPQASTTQTIPTFTVNFSDGDSVAVNPSLLVQNTDILAYVGGPPDAPVAGTLSGDAFTALGSQTSAVSNTIATTDADIAFAWTGENNDPNTAAWISGYTDKINADDVALITVSQSGTIITTATGTANIDGEWQTGTVDLSPGTYTVTMREYQATDTLFTNPLTPTSSALFLTEMPCFARGTLIRTEQGEIPVEALEVGDRVLTAFAPVRPIVWIGERKVDCWRHPRPDLIWPVRIRAGAFGANRPQRDLLLSPDHAVHAEGVLIPVKHLINGVTVVQERREAAHYFHIELASHDVLLAEGLPVESYLDTGNRAAFANGARHATLHPDFAARRGDDACAPLCAAGPPLVLAKQRLLERVERLGYATVNEPDLHVQAGGRAIRAAAVRGKLHQFLLPSHARDVRIHSRTAVPAEIDPASDDRRRLGAAIGGIFVAGKRLPLHHPALAGGFHAVEQHEAERWRWTDGMARLVLPEPRCRSGRLLELFVRDTMRHWREPGRRLAEAA